MKTSASIVEDEVRELVRRRQIDPSKDAPQIVEGLVDEVLTDYESRYEGTNLPRIADKGVLRKIVLDRVSGLGPLQQFLDDPEIEEI